MNVGVSVPSNTLTTAVALQLAQICSVENERWRICANNKLTAAVAPPANNNSRQVTPLFIFAHLISFSTVGLRPNLHCCLVLLTNNE